MIYSLSWRNLWRNPIRSAVIVTAIALGVSGGLFSMAFVNGMSLGRIRSGIANEVGDIQLHDSLFIRNPDIRAVIDSAAGREQVISETPEVRATATRLHVTAMASTATTGNGIDLIGVTPRREKTVSAIPDNIIEGRYLDDTKHNAIVLGEKLADKLDADLNSKVIITLQGYDSILTGGAFKVVGIYRTQNSSFDERTVFARSEDIRSLASIPDGVVHEIVARVTDSREADRISGVIAEKLPGNLVVQSWRDLAPDLAMLSGFMNYMMYLFLAIILAALAFGIVNTMLMAIMERRRELGMLMAVGMSGKRVFGMVMIETVLLSLSGGLIGMLFAAGGIGATNRYGIDLSAVAQGLSAIGLGTVIRPTLSPGLFVVMAGMITLTAALSALYPSFKAVEINPAEALRNN